jgi:thiosulfate/3-mercaptopyruvate sulfurtransferase
MNAYTTLITVDQLAPHLDDPDWRIVDCRFDLGDVDLGDRQYRESHLPGAIYAHLDRELSDKIDGINRGRHPLPARETTRVRFEAMGIGDGTQVVAYDAAGGMNAARLWWMLRWIGHANVAVLDGGMPAWVAAGQPISDRPGSPRAARLSMRDPLTKLVSVAEVEAASLSGGPTIVDARASDRYAGLNETIDPVAGHIPGAVNRFFKDNLDATGRFKDPETLRREFAAVTSSTDLIHSCGSGVTACHNLLATRHAGLSEGSLYGGSWSEWVTDPSRAIAR